MLLGLGRNTAPWSAPIGAQDGVMRDYLGPNMDRARADFGARARFLDGDLHEISADEASGCVLWQSPLPGEALGAQETPTFLVVNLVPVPDVVGLTVSTANTVLAESCLVMDVVTSCDSDAQASAPTAAQRVQYVGQQCTNPDELVPPGSHIGVVVVNTPPPQSLWFAIGLGVLAALALALALMFYVRYTAARDELDIMKQPRGPKK
ncbi:MAG: hypothetical protein IT454_04750 [Planctomycetes bacterium]|nr:hypothetical protein [Planctomycetota bacterium]